VIVDYKTGRSGLGADDARGSRALALYAFAAERVFRRRCRRVELHHLPTGTVAAHEHSEESLQRHVRRAEQTAADVMTAEGEIAGGADPDAAFPTNPGSMCGWCDFRRVCPAGAARPGHEPWTSVERGLAAAVDPAPAEYLD
jgi:putative RecB family exonuclease